jgi:sugar phosphate isomerase/epimerase
MYSRREFGKLALASLPLSAAFANGKPNSKINGVQLGAQSYSFRTLPSVDDAIKAMAGIGLSECELWQGHVEPKQEGRAKDAREELRKWRLTAPMDHFTGIASKFKNAGINLYAYNYSFRDDMTDEEIKRGFEMAKALGAKCITASATVSVTKRVAPEAEKAKMLVGMHGHDNLKDPNQFARPESFEKAMSESKWIAVNLDIGHFTAAGYDPMEFLEKYHERVVTLHIKDRKKNQGPNMPFGEGDTNIKGVLQLLKAKKWKIPANIEYEYKGESDPETEVRKCYEFCKKALA